MLFFILPGLLMTWGLASLLIHPGDSSPPDNGEGTKVTTDLGDEDDFFEGNAADDTVISNGGDDEIYGYRGADVIALGDGDDIGHGGSGTDVIYGADGNDFLDGGSNDDRLFGGDGDDATFIPATDTTDAIYGDERGNDFIRGGAGNDALYDGAGSNTIYGDSGNDIVDTVDFDTSAGKVDFAYGGTGDDDLYIDDGDTAEGGDGADIFGVIYDVGDDPVTIVDYIKADGDMLFIQHADADTATVTATEADGNTTILVDGVAIMNLTGVTGFDTADVSLVVPT
jgi:Ca2+-binding RTX toxin-like protein